MAATAAQRARLRRMIHDTGADAYDDDTLDEYIEAYPLRDGDGNEPADTAWVATYDLHAAAADIWQEKAATVWDKFNFTAVGEATYQRATKHDNAMRQARYHRARAAAKARIVVVEPAPASDEWIGNLPEDD